MSVLYGGSQNQDVLTQAGPLLSETDVMTSAVVTWNCFPACRERRTPTQLDAAAPTC